MMEYFSWEDRHVWELLEKMSEIQNEGWKDKVWDWRGKESHYEREKFENGVEEEVFWR